MDKIETFRQFISPFITGENADALIATLADQAQNLEDLSIAVTDQLTISTASGEYLEKRLSEVGITEPFDLGMSDDALRAMGIKITATKQINSVIQSILETFYGSDAVRANTTSSNAEPYILQDGMDLIVSFEDDVPLTITLNAASFVNVNQATAQEIADILTQNISAYGKSAFALVYADAVTSEKYVRIYGGAIGPYSLVRVLGGQVQNVLEFPSIRLTDLGTTVISGITYDNNDTLWNITRPASDTLRFWWQGTGHAPALSQISVGDKVMIYGSQFLISLGGGNNVDLRGTFDVTAVRPPQSSVFWDAGWFEITNPNSQLLSSTPGPSGWPIYSPAGYTYSVRQATFDDLKFFYCQKNTSYSQLRYSAAFEPRNKLLKVYLPVTTGIIYRNLIGGAHLHLRYQSSTFNGAHTVEVVNDYALRYVQDLEDAEGLGGTITYLTTTVDVDSISRENGYTTVITTVPHMIPNSSLVSVSITSVQEDDQVDTFLGPYMWDLTSKGTLTSQIVTTRETIFAGESSSTILVNDQFIDESGIFMIDVGTDQEEGPISYNGIQSQNQPITVNISSSPGWSSFGNYLTVQTATPHGAIVGSRVIIAGSGNALIDGQYTVVTRPSALVYIATPHALTIPAASGTIGTSTVILNNTISTVLLGSAYIFQYNHDVGASLTVLSSKDPYKPVPDGSDYSCYTTGTANGLIFAQQLIEDIVAAGISLEIILVYPGHQGIEASDIAYVWSEI